MLCQITSKAYSDPTAIEIKDTDFVSGALKQTSYARPGKLFTANEKLIVSEVGLLRKDKFEQIVNEVIGLLKSSI